MTIGIAPAGPKTAAAVIRSLLAQGKDSGNPIQIKAWYRDPSKAPEEFTSQPNFEALQADVLEGGAVDFSGVDAVLTVPPPFFTSGDMVALTQKLASNIKTAVEKAGTVQRLVLLSSGGAHLDKGVGEIRTKTAAERILTTTNVPRITVIRPHYFMENWAMQFPTINGEDPFIASTITPLEFKLPMVAVKDIGAAGARELTTTADQPTKLYTYELVGPSQEGYSPSDVRDALVKSIGKDIDIKGIPQSELQGLFSQMLPPAVVPEFVEMVSSFLPGGTLEKHPDPNAIFVHGETTLETALGDAVRAAREVGALSA